MRSNSASAHFIGAMALPANRKDVLAHILSFLHVPTPAGQMMVLPTRDRTSDYEMRQEVLEARTLGRLLAAGKSVFANGRLEVRFLLQNCARAKAEHEHARTLEALDHEREFYRRFRVESPLLGDYWEVTAHGLKHHIRFTEDTRDSFKFSTYQPTDQDPDLPVIEFTDDEGDFFRLHIHKITNVQIGRRHPGTFMLDHNVSTLVENHHVVTIDHDGEEVEGIFKGFGFGGQGLHLMLACGIQQTFHDIEALRDLSTAPAVPWAAAFLRDAAAANVMDAINAMDDAGGQAGGDSFVQRERTGRASHGVW